MDLIAGGQLAMQLRLQARGGPVGSPADERCRRFNLVWRDGDDAGGLPSGLYGRPHRK
jgi:hypothetical protein